MVGMNAAVDDVHLGEESIVGALSLLKAGSSWPKKAAVFGNPAAIQGKVSDDMLAHKSEGTALYQSLPLKPMNPCMKCPPEAIPDDRIEDFPVFETWQGRGRHLRNQKGGRSGRRIQEFRKFSVCDDACDEGWDGCLDPWKLGEVSERKAAF